MARQNSASHIRRAQIVSLSLTELMLLLVFMAVAFSFLAKKEGLVEVPRVRAQLDDALKENKRLKAANSDLTRQLAAAKDDDERLKRFLESINIDSVTLKPKDNVIIVDGKSYVLSHTTGQAPGHPQCTLKSVFLLNLTLLSDMQILGTPAWDSTADLAVANMPGVSVLSSGKVLSLPEFEAAAQSLFSSSLATNNCVFAVRATRETKDADAFDAELIAVQRYFDVSHH